MSVQDVGSNLGLDAARLNEQFKDGHGNLDAGDQKTAEAFAQELEKQGKSDEADKIRDDVKDGRWSGQDEASLNSFANNSLDDRMLENGDKKLLDHNGDIDYSDFKKTNEAVKALQADGHDRAADALQKGISDGHWSDADSENLKKAELEDDKNVVNNKAPDISEHTEGSVGALQGVGKKDYSAQTEGQKQNGVEW